MFLKNIVKNINRIPEHEAKLTKAPLGKRTQCFQIISFGKHFSNQIELRVSQRFLQNKSDLSEVAKQKSLRIKPPSNNK